LSDYFILKSYLRGSKTETCVITQTETTLSETQELTRKLAISEAAEEALGKVIQIIARSAGDVEGAMQAVLQGALDICQAQLGILFRYEAQKGFRAEHFKGVPQVYVDYLTEQGWFHVSPNTGLGRVEARLAPVNVDDVAAENSYAEREPLRVATVELGGARSFLAVPMMAGQELVGALSIYRNEVSPFAKADVDILKRFADQSVVALENARLLHEAQALSNQLGEMNRSLMERVKAQVEELERLSTLRRFLPKQVAELVLADGKDALLSSHRRKIAALFCDLRGFTSFSETAEPEEVMEVLEQFHNLTGNVVGDYSGTIVNRAGDSLMVILNDPLPVKNAADQAVRLSVAMRSALLEACARWQELGYPLGVGIGLASGYATLGLVGSAGQYDYTAVGTVVNMASRLCGEAAHGQILATQRLIAECSEQPEIEEIGEREIKGVSRPVRLCAVKKYFRGGP